MQDQIRPFLQKVHTFIASELPSIKLPHSTGNLAAWMNFSNLFEILIIYNYDLFDVELFMYLKLVLEGVPLALVQSLALTGDNFEVAWTLQVKQNYKELIMSHQIDAILQVTVAHLNSTAYMCYILSTVNANVAALKALKLPGYHWDILLLHHLEKHQPHFKLGQSKSTLSWKIQGQSHTTTSAYLVTPPSVCCVCKYKQSIYHCSMFAQKSLRERFECFKEQKLCINYLQPLDRARNSLSSTSCHHCLSRHHSLLHFTSVDIDSSDQQPHESTVSVEMLGNIAGKKKDPSETVLSSFSERASCATLLLSTTIGEVQDTLGNYQQVPVLLYYGSQAGFISEDALSHLGLSHR
ncbi:hypothetical protein PR048_013664 [Dryococelus australis]|uniref:Uncharacterized protein n=1 Tax=Dryococelus australis TaxID=614101 RepID=A0ABQ9HSU4_9NEOP|nr:hypothetical protein PR048_013664 [Dryococelus australis]